jgi:hypothetical protein
LQRKKRYRNSLSLSHSLTLCRKYSPPPRSRGGSQYLKTLRNIPKRIKLSYLPHLPPHIAQRLLALRSAPANGLASMPNSYLAWALCRGVETGLDVPRWCVGAVWWFRLFIGCGQRLGETNSGTESASVRDGDFGYM